MTVSLPTLHKAFRKWMAEQIRIDRWTLDAPSVLATRLQGKAYPANTAATLPAQQIDFNRSDYGSVCEATIRFQIKYRFSKQLAFDQLPIEAAEGVLNNLFLLALEDSGGIHPSILNIGTPEEGIDVFIGRVEENKDSDWLIILNPDFRVEFKAGYADLSDLQPPNEEQPPVSINRLELAIFRAIPGFDPANEDTYTLDRQITIFEQTE